MTTYLYVDTAQMRRNRELRESAEPCIVVAPRVTGDRSLWQLARQVEIRHLGHTIARMVEDPASPGNVNVWVETEAEVVAR